MDKSPISELQEITVKLGYIPEYQLLTLYNGTTNYFHCILTCKDETVSAYGRNKKEAKHNGALEMLKKLGEKKVINLSSSEIANENQSLNTNGSDMIKSTNYIGLLQTICEKNHLCNPTFIEAATKGLECRKIFSVLCSMPSTKVVGEGFSKKGAKQNAARKMIGHIIGSDTEEDILNCISKSKHKSTESNITELEDKMESNLKLNVAKVPVLMDDNEIFSLYKETTQNTRISKTSQTESLSNDHYLVRDKYCEDDCIRIIKSLKSLFIRSTDNVDIDNTIGKISEVLTKPIGPEVLLKCHDSIYAIGYSIKCLPPIVEIGMGSSLIAAKVAAINKLIKSTIILLQ